jgi:hypothetical protein
VTKTGSSQACRRDLNQQLQQSAPMRTEHDFEAMARDLVENGFDDEQAERYDAAFGAAKVAAVAILCALYGVDEDEMLDALVDSRHLNAQAQAFVERIECSEAFIGHIHSGLAF